MYIQYILDIYNIQTHTHTHTHTWIFIRYKFADVGLFP